MKIAIDIGHAKNTGARGHGYEEHALCSVVAPLLQDLLLAQGHELKIFDYPELSNSADLNSSVRDINAWAADLVISLHADASDNANAKGAHVCYMTEAGYKLACAIAAPLTALLPGRAESTQHRPGLYILRATNAPAVLVECGFITNTDDVAILANAPKKIACAIADGVANHLDDLPW